MSALARTAPFQQCHKHAIGRQVSRNRLSYFADLMCCRLPTLGRCSFQVSHGSLSAVLDSAATMLSVPLVSMAAAASDFGEAGAMLAEECMGWSSRVRRREEGLGAG